ncbi:uncharacterized protein LOC134697835 [Mytilus trossulus]|uniref:uncharacterized protein LOC134697835 n=1 Tax=Mytilus trossulus TaxID=6551 RepID=UPI00300508ED
MNLKAGVPQGSVLGLFLVLIFINGNADDMIGLSRMYADDTSIGHTAPDETTLQSMINIDLQNNYSWANDWLVKFNPNKSVHITTNVSTKVNDYVDALGTADIMNYAIDISRCNLDLSGITSLMFEIKACDNGHVLLSNSYVRDSSKPLYEILIGEDNYYSVIFYRTDDSLEPGSYIFNQSNTYNILNCNVYLPFWISWADGDIKLGTGILVDENVLVSFMNPHHFEVRSIGVFTSHYKLGIWTIQVEVSDKFTGYFDSCSMENTKSDMVVVDAIKCSAMRCATSCGMSKTCMGYNFNSAMNRCELLSFESNVVTDIPNHLEAGWRFYSKCNNGKTACLGCCL